MKNTIRLMLHIYHSLNSRCFIISELKKILERKISGENNFLQKLGKLNCTPPSTYANNFRFTEKKKGTNNIWINVFPKWNIFFIAFRICILSENILLEILGTLQTLKKKKEEQYM